jgi:hypothetical protein
VLGVLLLSLQSDFRNSKKSLKLAGKVEKEKGTREDVKIPGKGDEKFGVWS